MRRTLSGIGRLIYVTVMLIGVLADIGLLVWLFASGKGGWAGGFLIFGSWLVPTVAHLIGMVLASPFIIAGEMGQKKPPVDAAKSPFGIGWIEGVVGRPIDGSFAASPSSLMFTPRDRRGSDGPIRRYNWDAVNWARLEPREQLASDLEEAHPEALRDRPNEMIVGFLTGATGIEGEDCFVVVAQHPYSATDWIASLRSAGVDIKEQPGGQRTDEETPAH